MFLQVVTNYLELMLNKEVENISCSEQEIRHKIRTVTFRISLVSVPHENGEITKRRYLRVKIGETICEPRFTSEGSFSSVLVKSNL